MLQKAETKTCISVTKASPLALRKSPGADAAGMVVASRTTVMEILTFAGLKPEQCTPRYWKYALSNAA